MRIRVTQSWILALALGGATSVAHASISFLSGRITASAFASSNNGGFTNYTAPPVVYGTEMGVHSIQALAINPAGTAIALINMSSTREPDVLLIDVNAEMGGGGAGATTWGQAEVTELIELSEATTLRVTAFAGPHSALVMSFRLPGSQNNIFATGSTATRLFDAGQYEVRATYNETD